jgi:N-acyl-D-amino-acid deacylase
MVCKFKDEIIAPGFIDTHGHSDLSQLEFPAAESKRRQGVTCEITGNCGLSAFPVTTENQEHLDSLYASYGIPLAWHDLPGYQQQLAVKQVKLRTFPLCGHNTLRAAVAGYEKKSLSSGDLKQMKQLLSAALRSGSPGLSTGLLYTPGCFADPAELQELMKTLAQHDAVYTTHLRSEGDHLLESLKETLENGRIAGLKKIQISHLKTAGKDNWHKLDAALELIENYRADGMDVRFDRYPYTESQTMLSVILPAPFDTMPDRDITIALQDENAVNMIFQALPQRPAEDWQRWRLTGTTHPRWQKFTGRKYDELGEEKIRAVVEQLAYDATTATIGAAGMSEKNMLKIINHPLCMPGSDGNALPGSDHTHATHPRAFGAIARFVRLKLDSGNSIGKTVNSVSHAPATFFSLTDIGEISAGKKADITVFSPDNIDCKADFIAPRRFAEGIVMSMVDGCAEFY